MIFHFLWSARSLFSACTLQLYPATHGEKETENINLRSETHLFAVCHVPLVKSILRHDSLILMPINCFVSLLNAEVSRARRAQLGAGGTNFFAEFQLKLANNKQGGGEMIVISTLALKGPHLEYCSATSTIFIAFGVWAYLRMIPEISQLPIDSRC